MPDARCGVRPIPPSWCGNWAVMRCQFMAIPTVAVSREEGEEDRKMVTFAPFRMRTWGPERASKVLRNLSWNWLLGTSQFLRPMRTHRTGTVLALLLLFLAGCLASGDDEGHDGHDHGGGGGDFEWSGIFATQNDKYIWSAQAVEGKYADPEMKMVVLPADAATENELLHLAKEAGHAFETTCIDVDMGGTITAKLDTCYLLKFPPPMLDSTFYIKPGGAKNVAFFTAHMPTEFERTNHYFKDLDGEDIEPIAQTGMPEEVDTLPLRIGALFAILVVTAATLVIFMFPATQKISTVALLYVRALSAGSMLSVAIVHIIPEAGHALEKVTEFPLAATLCLGGICFAFALEGLGGHDHSQMPTNQLEVVSVPESGIEMKDQKVMGSGFGTVEEDSALLKMSTPAHAVHSMEIGCISHSIVLGIALGLQTEQQTVVLLLIVFLFHQAMEGACLSSLIASLKSQAMKMFFVSATAGSMPLGILIGILIEQTAGEPVTASGLLLRTDKSAC